MKSHATRKPDHGPSERAAYVYMPPADGNSLASWPIAVAAQMHAISASATDSGSACRESGTEMKIEYATAAAGAMCVIDWNSTCQSPIECSRRWSKRRGSPAVAASMGSSFVGSVLPRSSRTARGWCNRGEATMALPGGVPERPKGTGCKPVGSAYGGSNPPAPTRFAAAPWARSLALLATRFPLCAPRWVDASRERTMRAKIVRTFRGMTVRVFWYISKTKVDNYAGADRHWTERLGGHVRVGLPLVEVGVEATGPPDRGLVEKLEHIERRAKHDDGVLSVVEIGAEPPVLF